MASTLEPETSQLAEYDQFIAEQIRKTRGQVKGVEIAGAVLRLLVGVLVYLLLVALADHWLLAEGLGPWGRLAALAGFVLGIGAYLVGVIVPLVVRRVNPVFAAHTIEQQEPSLKNSLVNFLLLRGHRREVAPAVYQAIEVRAARDLSHVPVESVVDRSRLVRWCYGLLAVVVLFALYMLLSPKDPLRSLARMMAPWADLRPATRVTIEEVEPGNTQAFHGDTIHVTALVRGVSAEEPVTLYYSTDDGQTTDEAIVMTVPAGGYRHEADLPESSAGLQQGVQYYIGAGDFETARYRVDVLTAPAIIVEAVEYRYPEYASLANQRREKIGDIAALAGTQVTVYGRANRAIKSAWLDLNCDGTRDRPMTVEGQETRADFDLKVTPEGKAEYSSYQLLFVGEDGRENPQPIRHSIEVVPDRAPIVEIVLPAETQLDVPQNGAVTVAVRAEDPDFALRTVLLHAKRGNDVLLVSGEELLPDGAAPHVGEFRGGYVLDLTKLAPEKTGRPPIAVGHTIEYWAEARDIKQPTANRSETVHYQLRVTSPTDEERREEQLAAEEEKRQEFEKPEEGRAAPGDESAEYQVASREPGPGEEQPREENASQDQPADDEAGHETQVAERVDPEERPADAMREILERQKEQEASKEPQGDSSQPQQPGEQSSGEGSNQQNQPGEQSGDPSGGNSSGDRSSSGSQSQPGGEAESSSGDSASGGTESSESSGQSPGGEAVGESKPDAGGAPGGDKSGDGEQGSEGDNAQTTGDKGSGQAAERIRREESGDGKGRTERPQDGEQPGGAGQQAKSSDQGANQRGEQQDGANQGEPKSNPPTEAPTEAPGDSPQPEGGDPKAAKSQEDSPQLETKNDQPGDKTGDGAQSGQSGDAKKPTDKPSDQAPKNSPRGGEPQDPKGNSGAGQGQGNEQGSPSPQEKNTPREKQQQSPDRQSDEPSEPGSPSTSPRESDSQGGEEGDRSGGGEQGGGQKANQQGTGGAGQNTAADEGGGAAAGSGSGPTSNQPGDKQPGGQGGNQQGKSDSGAGKGDGSGESSTSSGEGGAGGGSGAQGERNSPGSSTGPGSGNQPGGRGGGGTEGTAEVGNGEVSASEPQGDEANLEYARQATELALERLDHDLKEGEIDQELLDRLGWTKDDVAKFLKRWEEMKQRAAGQGPEADEARRRLDDALRQSLGLRSGGTSLEGNRVAPDDERATESFRSNPPSEYSELFRAYTEGLSRGQPTKRP